MLGRDGRGPEAGSSRGRGDLRVCVWRGRAVYSPDTLGTCSVSGAVLGGGVEPGVSAFVELLLRQGGLGVCLVGRSFP